MHNGDKEMKSKGICYQIVANSFAFNFYIHVSNAGGSSEIHNN